jgi:hypothetical protein
MTQLIKIDGICQVDGFLISSMLNALYVECQFLTVDLEEDIIPRVLKLYDSMREN